MQQPELQVHTVATDSLVPYANNSKLHDDAQVETIVASMQEFGNCDPIAVWHNAKGEPEIVEGHGRLLALKKLGIEQAPVIYLDHLTDEQRRAYSHVHNQTNLNSGIDFSKISVDFGELDFDWNSFGFDPIDLINQETDAIETYRREVSSVSDIKQEEGEWEELSPEELEAYAENARSGCLKSFSVILVCMDDEDKEYVAQLLATDVDSLRRMYRVKELRA